MSTSQRAAARGAETAAAVSARCERREARAEARNARQGNPGLRTSGHYYAMLREDADQFIARMGRYLYSAAERATASDPEVAGPALVALRETHERAELIAVAGWRKQGVSWGEIARGFGVSRQAAENRWRAAVAAYLAAERAGEATT